MPYIRGYRRMAYEKASDYGRKAHARTSQQSYRKTIGIVLGMLVVLIGAGIALPHVFAGGLQTDEALLGRDGGISIVRLNNGTSKQLLKAPAAGEAYTTWALSPDRSMFLVALCHEKEPPDPSSADRLELQLCSAYSGGRRWEYPLDARAFSAADLQIGYIPGTKDVWLLSRGRLWTMNDSSGVVKQVSMPWMRPHPNAVAFSPDGKKIAIADLEDNDQGLMVALFDGSKLVKPEEWEFLEAGDAAISINETTLPTDYGWYNARITSLSMVSADEIAVGVNVPNGFINYVGKQPSGIWIARLSGPGSDWSKVPLIGQVFSVSSSPERKSVLAFATGDGGPWYTVLPAGARGRASRPLKQVPLTAGQSWRGPAAWSAP